MIRITVQIEKEHQYGYPAESASITVEDRLKKCEHVSDMTELFRALLRGMGFTEKTIDEAIPGYDTW